MKWKESLNEFLKISKKKTILTAIIFSVSLIPGLIFASNCWYFYGPKPVWCDYLLVPSFLFWVSFSIAQDILDAPMGYPRTILTIIITLLISYLLSCFIVWVYKKRKKK